LRGQLERGARHRTKIIEARDEYLRWLQNQNTETHGSSDLVAYFFRRSFELLRENGCFGLIATNTLSQGDTRYTGLRWLRRNGATFYRAVKRYVWPNEAAVIISIVHARKGRYEGPAYIGDRQVPLITASLTTSQLLAMRNGNTAKRSRRFRTPRRSRR